MTQQTSCGNAEMSVQVANLTATVPGGGAGDATAPSLTATAEVRVLEWQRQPRRLAPAGPGPVATTFDQHVDAGAAGQRPASAVGVPARACRAATAIKARRIMSSLDPRTSPTRRCARVNAGRLAGYVAGQWARAWRLGPFNGNRRRTAHGKPDRRPPAALGAAPSEELRQALPRQKPSSRGHLDASTRHAEVYSAIPGPLAALWHLNGPSFHPSAHTAACADEIPAPRGPSRVSME